MRTTLTLEDDVEVLLERFRKAHDLGFKQAVNSALREGLVRLLSKRETPLAETKTMTANLGKCFIPIDNVAEALADAEGEDRL